MVCVWLVTQLITKDSVFFVLDQSHHNALIVQRDTIWIPLTLAFHVGMAVANVQLAQAVINVNQDISDIKIHKEIWNVLPSVQMACFHIFPLCIILIRIFSQKLLLTSKSTHRSTLIKPVPNLRTMPRPLMYPTGQSFQCLTKFKMKKLLIMVF